VSQKGRPEHGRDRDGAPTGVGLRLDEALDCVPGSLDSDHVRVEVDVAQLERAELATAQAGVHRGGPHGAILLERREEGCRFLGSGDSVAASAYRRKLEAAGRVDREVAARDGAAEDRAKRHQAVADRRRVLAFGEQPVDERLQV